MKTSRTKFVGLFLICGSAYTSFARLVLNQMPGSLLESRWVGSPSQAPWQSAVTTLLSPIKFVLMGPLLPVFNWMLDQDGDPPPPMIMLMFVVYWTVLALVIHYFLSKRKTSASSGLAQGSKS